MMRLLKLDAWTQPARAALEPCANSFDWPLIVQDVAEGRAELFRCSDDYPAGDSYAVLRIDGGELVIVAAAGVDAHRLFEAALAIAAGNGLRMIRFHSKRPGLERLLARFGPAEVERVYRVAVQHG